MDYQAGETIRLTATVTNIAGSAADPATMKININKPNGKIAGEEINMIKKETGFYYYDYLIPEDTGAYRYNIVAVGVSGRVTIVRDKFSVQPPM